LLSLVLIQQGDLVKQTRTQCKQLTSLQTFDRQLTTPFTNIFEQAVEGLNSQRT